MGSKEESSSSALTRSIGSRMGGAFSSSVSSSAFEEQGCSPSGASVAGRCGAKLAAALKQDPEATAAFKGELERLEENGLPLLQEWVWEAAAVVYQWTQTVLRAARNAARDVAQDPWA